MLAERSVIIATTPGTRSLPVATLCKTPSHALLKSLAIVVPPISVEFDPTFFSTHRSLSESNDLEPVPWFESVRSPGTSKGRHRAQSNSNVDLHPNIARNAGRRICYFPLRLPIDRTRRLPSDRAL